KAAINAVGAPINGNLTGIGTWTKGAMDKTYAYIQKTWSDHPLDKQKRKAGVVLLTDGQWTGPSGSGSPADENPSATAATMFNVDQVPTYVVAIGDAMGQGFADEIAAAGGTGQAYPAGDPQQLINALKMV